MPTLVGFVTFAALSEEQIRKRSAVAFSPVIKGCSYGGASGLQAGARHMASGIAPESGGRHWY